MEKKKISVQIEGRSYSLITTDDEKYVQKVAHEVVSHIRKAAQSTKQLDTRDCAVLAALNFCDDRNKAIKKNKDYVDKADKIIQQTNELNKMCKEYKEKLTESMNENTRLIRDNKELEKKITVLKFEIEQLKKSEKTADTKESRTEKSKEKQNKNNNDSADVNKSDVTLNVLSNEAKKTEEELRNEKLLGYVPMKQYSLFDEEKNEKN